MGLSLRGTTSGAIDINAPAVAGDNTITLPGNNGSANQFFKNSGTAGIVTFSSMVETTTGVGIGTDNPIYKLDVLGTNVLANIKSTNNNYVLQFAGNNCPYDVYVGSDNANNFLFANENNNGTFTERLRITSDGLVGIKTASPAAPLHVYDATNNTIVRIESGDATCRLQVKDSAGEAYVIASGDNLIFANTSSITERLRISSAGSLKLGTSESLELRPGTNVSNQIDFVSYNYSTSSYLPVKNIASEWRWHDGDDGERMRIDSSGRLLIGHTSPAENNNMFEVSTTYGGRIGFLRTDTTTSAGNNLGMLCFYGNDSNGTYQESARIQVDADLDHATGDKPGRIKFLTSPDGSNTVAERLRINSDGKVLVGTEAGRSAGDVNGQLQVEGTNLHTASMNLISNAGASTDNNVHLSLCKSRGTSDGSNTIVANGDNLGTIQWCGADGTDLNSVAAMVQAFVDNTPGSNDMPGRLSFWTTEDGSPGPTERMRIDSKGRVNIGDLFDEDYVNTRLWVNGYDNLIVSEGNSTGWTEGAFKCVAPDNSRGGGIFMFNSNGGGTTNQWFAGRPYSNSDQYIIARSTGMHVAQQSTAQTSNQLFSVYSSGNALLQGTLTESGSDDKLKKNRTPLTSALEKVKTLEGFTYNWNDDAINNYGFPSDEGTLVGMSAQELQSVLPEAVKSVSHDKEVSDPTSGDAGEKQEYLTIQYGRVVPLLVEAIKELSAKVAALEGS